MDLFRAVHQASAYTRIVVRIVFLIQFFYYVTTESGQNIFLRAYPDAPGLLFANVRSFSQQIISLQTSALEVVDCLSTVDIMVGSLSALSAYASALSSNVKVTPYPTLRKLYPGVSVSGSHLCGI